MKVCCSVKLEKDIVKCTMRDAPNTVPVSCLGWEEDWNLNPKVTWVQFRFFIDVLPGAFKSINPTAEHCDLGGLGF